MLDSDPLDLYLAPENGNTLYTFADTIAGRAMLQDIDASDHQKAFDTIVAESAKVLGWLNQVIAACLIIAVKRHVGAPDLESLGAETVEVNGAPDLSSVEIPFFVVAMQSGRP